MGGTAYHGSFLRVRVLLAERLGLCTLRSNEDREAKITGVAKCWVSL